MVYWFYVRLMIFGVTLTQKRRKTVTTCLADKLLGTILLILNNFNRFCSDFAYQVQQQKIFDEFPPTINNLY